MFDWFKEKEVKPKPQWVIKLNGFGEYTVHSRRSRLGYPDFAAGLYFQHKTYANMQQAENAIAEFLEIERKREKVTVREIF